MCGEILLCDVSSCSEASVFLTLCDVGSFYFILCFLGAMGG